MKLTKFILIAIAILFSPVGVYAATTQVFNGGTGSSTLTGIIIGNGTSPVNSLTIGTGLNLTGTTLTSTATGGGSGTATSSFKALYPLQVISTTASITYALLNMATTTASCSGSTSCSSFTIIGTSPVTITSSSASSSLLSDNNTFTGVNNFTNASGNWAGTWQGFSPSHFQVAGTYVTSVGATYPLSSSGGTTPVISSATSSATSAGVLSAADWTTFNGKLGTTSISGTSPIVYTSSTGAFSCPTCNTTSANVVSVSNSDGTLTVSPTTGSVVASIALSHANTWTGQQTFNTSAPIFGTITGSTQCLHVNSAGLISGTGSDCGSGSGGVTTVTATYPLSSTGGTTPNISSATSSATSAGVLSAADWTTFNAKQTAGNYITALTGDVTATGPGSVAATLATVNSNVGTFTYPSVTVNGKGLVTAISSGAAPTTYTGTYPIVVTGSVISTPLATTTIQQTYGTPQIGAITFATTSTSFNGLTVADAISNSGGTFTIAPLWSGTLNSSGLTTTGVGAGSCTSCNLTYNAQGQLTVAANGSGGSLGYIPWGGSLATTFGTTTIASTTPAWFQGGLFASSTSATPTLAVTQSGAGPAAVFLGGNVAIGTTTAQDTVDILGSKVNIINNGGGVQFNVTRYSANTSGDTIFQNKGRGTLAVPAAIQSGDSIGSNTFSGFDGTAFTPSSAISAIVNGTVSTNIVPGNLTFSTANASGVLSEAMRIDASQNVGISSTTPGFLLTVGNVAGFASTVSATSTIWSSLVVATSSPNAFIVQDQYGTQDLRMSTASSTNNNPIFQIQATSTLDTLFQVDQYGHLTASSTRATPTISSCGTGTPTLSTNSNDVTGTVTTGTAATACTITFASAYSSAPSVVVSGASTISFAAVTAISTTAFTVGISGAVTGDNITYIVVMP